MRVVVTLDAVSENRTAIDTAARLAARAAARLHGVFVEDEDLLHLARLPFARQIAHGGRAEPFTADVAQLHLRAEGERARRQVVAAAARYRIEATFEIVHARSDIPSTLGSEAGLIVAGALTRPVAGHFRVRSQWWPSVEAAPGPVLLARLAWDAAGPVVALVRDRGPAAARLVQSAARVAAARDAPLIVIAPPGLAGAADFAPWLAECLAGEPATPRVEAASVEPAALQRRLAELPAGLVAVEAGAIEGDGARLRDFAEQCACDLLIVR
jgi:hypothetical protein